MDFYPKRCYLSRDAEDERWEERLKSVSFNGWQRFSS
jgi:hypothetical protein